MKRFHFKSTHLDDDGHVCIGKYGDGSLAILLRTDIGEPLSKPTVNLVEYKEKPQPGHVFIRDYAENEGMLVCLVELGIVEKPIRTIRFSHGLAYECKLLLPLDDTVLL